MVGPNADRRELLEEPLLREASFQFGLHLAAHEAGEHAVNVDDGGAASEARPEKVGKDGGKTLDKQRSNYFRSLSRLNSGSIFPGFEDPLRGSRVSASRSRRSKDKRRLRNPIKSKSLVRRAALSARHEPLYFIKNLIYGFVLWPRWAWDAISSQKNLTVLSLKAGLAAGLFSIFAVVSLPKPYDGFSSISVWAVVTIDILSEANIGLSLSKGVNRVAGTFSAGALAVILTQLGPDIPDSIYPYYVVFWVTFGGFVFRFLKGIPPLKDQWGYAFTVATIAFHILLLTTFQQPERVTLPILRFTMILCGFFMWSFINLAFKPVFAGDTLHKLVGKNFDTAAEVLQRCVAEYMNFTILDHVPDILCGRSEDDKIHQAYHEIVMSDSDVDKLIGAVTWEPCHGPFFRGYPWHLYDDITDYLRYTLYDIIALDSCLRASIQAPKFLRNIFSEDMKALATECATVLRTMAESMRNMRRFPSEKILANAEEAALSLQNKIYINTHLLLGSHAVDSPRYPMYVASSRPDDGPWYDSGFGRAQTGPGSVDQSEDVSKGTHDRQLSSESFQAPNNLQSDHDTRIGRDAGLVEGTDGNVAHGDDGGLREHSAPMAIPHHDSNNLTGESIGRSLVQGNGSYNSTQEIQPTFSSSAGQTYTGFSESFSRHRERISMEISDDGKCFTSIDVKVADGVADSSMRSPSTAGRTSEQQAEGGPPLKTDKPATPTSWKQSFMQRRQSLGPNWEGSLERISALSLVKFASLLIEVVAKMQFVVASVDELGIEARFEECLPPEDGEYCDQ